MTKEILFDRELLRQNSARTQQGFAQHNFLHHEVANRIAENVGSLNRHFENILEIGGRDGYLSTLVSCQSAAISAVEDCEKLDAVAGSFDLILSNLNFHFINEIPQFLLQVREALKPNGIFIASFFGEENLHELAHVLHQSEIEIYGGISPRMPPTIDVKTAAALLQKAGFADPISEFAKIEVNYSDPIKLLKDLKFMGQSNILTKRSRRFFTKKFLAKILENYHKLYGSPDGTVLATFEIVTITGWK